jgi:hypothetical protein
LNPAGPARPNPLSGPLRPALTLMHHPRLLLVPLLLVACVPGPENQTSASGDASSDASATTDPPPPPPTTGFDLVCEPGAVRCADDKNVEACAGTGLSWKPGEACGEHQTCFDGVCTGPCEKVKETPSSVGCEFVAIRMLSFIADAGGDALIVGNTDPALTAVVQLSFAPNNSHKLEPLGDPVQVPPGESHKFDLSNEAVKFYSAVRIGGVYHVKSDVPIAAYLHSTLDNKASNDSSLLLPLHTLRKDHVVASYPGFADMATPDTKNGRPSYFNVIAVENETTVSWTPRFDTYGDGLAVPPVKAGATESVPLNGYDILQVGSSSTTNLNYFTHDVSGTIISADKPVVVMGASNCAFVPFDKGYCNHLQEQMFPLDYWGERYVAAHSPLRGTEKHYWRIYAGEDGVTVTFDPAPPGQPPITLLERGQFADLVVDNGYSFVMKGSGPFLPVQYLAGFGEAGTIGDPSMYQMVPVEQWLKRYVFVTGVGYDLNYAQVIRKFGGADVTINGQVVTGYYLLNAVGADNRFEVADVVLAEGDTAHSYLAESADDFSINVIGYNVGMDNASAYAYPGGMALKPIYQP